MDRHRIPKKLCKDRTLTPDLARQLRRQDKSADLGRAHVVGRVRFFGDWTDRAYWRLRHKVQGIQLTERRRSRQTPPALRQAAPGPAPSPSRPSHST
jgi:hypothetical protein